MPYEQRRADRLTTVARWEQWHTRFGLVRVAIALSIPVIFWVGGWAAWPWAAAVGVAFLAFVAAHTRVIDARDRAQRAVDFYDRGLQRLRHEWPGHGDDGRRFAPSDVPKSRGCPPEPWRRWVPKSICTPTTSTSLGKWWRVRTNRHLSHRGGTVHACGVVAGAGHHGGGPGAAGGHPRTDAAAGSA